MLTMTSLQTKGDKVDYAKTVSGTKVLRNLMQENKIELYKLYVS